MHSLSCASALNLLISGGVREKGRRCFVPVECMWGARKMRERASERPFKRMLFIASLHFNSRPPAASLIKIPCMRISYLAARCRTVVGPSVKFNLSFSLSVCAYALTQQRRRDTQKRRRNLAAGFCASALSLREWSAGEKRFLSNC